MSYDYNLLERHAAASMEAGRYLDAISIYLFMADGDPSLDAGYLALKIGVCYEKLGHLITARYWYGRAVEENPKIPAYRAARDRLADVSIKDLIHD